MNTPSNRIGKIAMMIAMSADEDEKQVREAFAKA